MLYLILPWFLVQYKYTGRWWTFGPSWHRLLFYFQGRYVSLSHRWTGIEYVSPIQRIEEHRLFHLFIYVYDSAWLVKQMERGKTYQPLII